MFALSLTGGAELRPLEPWRSEEFFAHLERVRPHLLPWIPFASRVLDVEAARQLLQRFADEQARDGARIYGIWADGVLSGGTLFRVFDTGTGVCELGVWLAPEAEGRGIITAAARHMIDWAIGVRGMSRVEWWNDPANTRSRTVAQRLGMTLEGLLRSVYVVNGERKDSEVWAVLASQWRASA